MIRATTDVTVPRRVLDDLETYRAELADRFNAEFRGHPVLGAGPKVRPADVTVQDNTDRLLPGVREVYRAGGYAWCRVTVR